MGLAVTRMGGALVLAITNILVFRYKWGAFNEIGHKNWVGDYKKRMFARDYVYIYSVYIHIFMYMDRNRHLENRPRDCHFGRATVDFGMVARARPSFSVKVHPCIC